MLEFCKDGGTKAAGDVRPYKRETMAQTGGLVDDKNDNLGV